MGEHKAENVQDNFKEKNRRVTNSQILKAYNEL